MNFAWMQNKSWYGDGLHFLGAYAVVMSFHVKWPAAIAILLYAALKEFWFDPGYEKDPPQSYLDGARDFAGYTVGVALAMLL